MFVIMAAWLCCLAGGAAAQVSVAGRGMSSSLTPTAAPAITGKVAPTHIIAPVALQQQSSSSTRRISGQVSRGKKPQPAAAAASTKAQVSVAAAASTAARTAAAGNADSSVDVQQVMANLEATVTALEAAGEDVHRNPELQAIVQELSELIAGMSQQEGADHGTPAAQQQDRLQTKHRASAGAVLWEEGFSGGLQDSEEAADAAAQQEDEVEVEEDTEDSTLRSSAVHHSEGSLNRMNSKSARVTPTKAVEEEAEEEEVWTSLKGDSSSDSQQAPDTDKSAVQAVSKPGQADLQQLVADLSALVSAAEAAAASAK